MLKRIPLKKGTTTLKKSSLKRKSKTVEEKQQQKEDIEKMWELFEEHWQKTMTKYGAHWCESCSIRIWGENKSLYHDHLLEKSVYEEYKYDIDNLFLCCWECHTKKGNGFPTEKHKAAIDNAHKRYGI